MPIVIAPPVLVSLVAYFEVSSSRANNDLVKSSGATRLRFYALNIRNAEDDVSDADKRLHG